MSDRADSDWTLWTGVAMERARKAVGWSASRLSDRCRELGVPIHRVALGKMETGERTPTVDELTVIAAALNTSPAMLLFGTDLVEGSVALLPSLRTSADHALQWFSGKSSLTPDAQSAYSQANRPISLARDLETARHMLRHSVNDLAAAISRDDERVQMFREILRRSQDEVEFIESEIRESGLVLNSDDASDT